MVVEPPSHAKRTTGVTFRSRGSLQDFHTDERGGAYTLSYVMVIPFLMFLIALIVESTLIMSAKLGTVYAGYAAVRCASVHSTSVPWGETMDAAQLAAKQAMLPYASGVAQSPAPADSERGERIIRANTDWVQNPASNGYLRSKFADSAERLSVELGASPASWDAQISATITYRFPIHVPGLGPMIGESDSNGGYVFPLRTKVTLQNDAPQNSQRELGIGYGK